MQQRDKFQLQQQGLANNIASSEQRLAILVPELLKLDAQLKEVEFQLNQSRAVMSLTDYREQLVEGEPCPLCGQQSILISSIIRKLTALLTSNNCDYSN
ncbi:hypothetical protein Q8W15_23365 [Photobacterium damselae subsp. piscicida]|nr:hypothetical protein [Photobacterium damselae subsp. piscicida]MDP2559409.1 hypothetical protein [Photobacterium damselae subsp. piscicida]